MRSFRKAVGVLLMLTLALVLSVSAQAAETEDFQLKGGLLTAYHGPGGQVTIPEGVTHIGEFVFSGRWDITAVTIPQTVTSIGEEAFFGCSGIQTLTIPGSVRTIDKYAFADCTGLTTLTLNSGLRAMGEYAFGNCSALTEVTIPGTMTTVKDGFVNCTSLETVVLSSGVKKIDKGAFWDCASLSQVTIPEGVTRIGEGAFGECPSLKSVKIPDSVTAITDGAFLTWDLDVSPITASGPVFQNTDSGEARRYARRWNLTMEGGEESPVSFADVTPADWYYAPALWAFEKGIASGTGGNAFSPNQTCTRAEALFFLYASRGKMAPEGSNPFDDVSSGDYYCDAAVWAAERGLEMGDTLEPNTPCTRAQMIVYLWKLDGAPQAQSGVSFPDVAADAPYAQAVAWAYEQGITAGTPEGFSPDATCTRAQIMTFLYASMA